MAQGLYHVFIVYSVQKITSSWLICLLLMSLFIYGRKSKAVSNFFLSFLFCFSWWSSPGRLYEKTTLGMFQWASVIWGGEIIITITSSIIITSIPTIFMSLRSPEWPLTLKMEVTKSEVQLWRNELTVLLKHLMCTPKRTQMWNWSIDLYWVLVWLMVQTKKRRNLLCSVVYAGILCIQVVHHLLAYFWPICSMYSNFTNHVSCKVSSKMPFWSQRLRSYWYFSWNRNSPNKILFSFAWCLCRAKRLPICFISFHPVV